MRRLLLGALLAPNLASADPCAAALDGMAVGPVTAGLLDGDLGRARRACGRSEVGLTGSGFLLADVPNFYGHIVAGATVDMSGALSSRAELFGSLEVLRSDTVMSAITANYLGPGHTTFGGSYRFLVLDGLTLAASTKLVLPTAFGLYRRSWPFGMDLGVTASGVAGPLGYHGYLGLLGSAAASKGPTQARLGLAPTAGLSWRAGRAFALAAEISSSFAYTAPVDYVAAGVAFRFSDGRRAGFDLAATVPFAGRERALVTLDFRSTVRLGALARRALPAAADP